MRTWGRWVWSEFTKNKRVSFEDVLMECTVLSIVLFFTRWRTFVIYVEVHLYTDSFSVKLSSARLNRISNITAIKYSQSIMSASEQLRKRKFLIASSRKFSHQKDNSTMNYSTCERKSIKNEVSRWRWNVKSFFCEIQKDFYGMFYLITNEWI